MSAPGSRASFRPAPPSRDEAYLAHVRQRPCALCGREPVEAHHLKLPGEHTMGRKPSDYLATPACPDHHRAIHEARITVEDRLRLYEVALSILTHYLDTVREAKVEGWR